MSRRTWWLAATAVMLSCGPQPEEQEALSPRSSESQPSITGVRTSSLYAKTGTALWIPGEAIPVCWTTPGFDAEKTIMRDKLLATWPVFGNVLFTGFQPCPTAGNASFVRVWVLDGTDQGGGGSAVGYGKSVLRLPSTDPTVHSVEINLPLSRYRGRIEYLAVHEFGHVLGFAHEQDRADNTRPVDPVCNPAGGDSSGSFFTPYDGDSVMDYCNSRGNNSGDLSVRDRQGVAAAYPFNWHPPRGAFYPVVASSRQVTGWVADPNAPNTPVGLTLNIRRGTDAPFHVAVNTNYPDPNVYPLTGITGNHGFLSSMPSNWIDGRVWTIDGTFYSADNRGPFTLPAFNVTFPCDAGKFSCSNACWAESVTSGSPCSSDCACGSPAGGMYCAPAAVCAPALLFTRSFSIAQTIPYNGATLDQHFRPTGGTYTDILGSSTSFSVSSARGVTFRFTFDVQYDGAGSSTSLTSPRNTEAAEQTSGISSVISTCNGIVAGPPQMVLALRLVIDNVPTQQLLVGLFDQGTNTFSPTVSLSAGPHSVRLQALDVFKCGASSVDINLSGSPAVFSASIAR